jgi:hypothetical protein
METPYVKNILLRTINQLESQILSHDTEKLMLPETPTVDGDGEEVILTTLTDEEVEMCKFRVNEVQFVLDLLDGKRHAIEAILSSTPIAD